MKFENITESTDPRILLAIMSEIKAYVEGSVGQEGMMEELDLATFGVYQEGEGEGYHEGIWEELKYPSRLEWYWQGEDLTLGYFHYNGRWWNTEEWMFVKNGKGEYVPYNFQRMIGGARYYYEIGNEVPVAIIPA